MTVPTNPVPPQPPTGLSITSVARNSDGTNITVSAAWKDDTTVPTTYTFYGNGEVLSTGTLLNTAGTYNTTWSGKLKQGSLVSFEVCDANYCTSQLI